MKTIAILIACLASNFIFAQQTLTATMTGVPNENGYVAVGLYTEATFLKAAPDYHAQAKIENGVAKAVFEDVPAGEYAVVVYQDENENQRIDREPNGIPKEAYGSSNNIQNPFGPPQWQDSKFMIADEPVNLEIKMVSM